MRRVSALVIGLAFLAGCASTSDKKATVEALLNGISSQVSSGGLEGEKLAIDSERLEAIFATVMAVDVLNRKVTLKDSREKTFTVNLGHEERNLHQVKVGDKVVVNYYAVLAIKLSREGNRGISVKETTARARPGKRQAGVVAKETTWTGAIAAIDKEASTVILQSTHQSAHTIKFRDTKNLEKVKVGDQVAITYIEAVAISVEKP